MKTVMIVDDDKLIRSALRSIAESDGHHVIDAPDGKAALALLADHTPDLVITDIFMPEMDGLEFVRALRKSHPDVRVVAMSGGGVTSAPTVLAPALAFGASAVLHKPFGVEEVRAELRFLEIELKS